MCAGIFSIKVKYKSEKMSKKEENEVKSILEDKIEVSFYFLDCAISI